MPKFKSSKEVCSECERDGLVIRLEEVDIAKIQHMLRIAQADLDVVKALVSETPKDSPSWSTLYKLQYDALHQLIDAFLRFDRIKTNNHQCLFAYLCETHPDLVLDWNFFEKVRTKRNGIQYYGTPGLFLIGKNLKFRCACTWIFLRS